MSRRKRFFINGIILTLTALSVKTVSMWHNSYVSENVGAEGVGLFAVILTVPITSVLCSRLHKTKSKK